MRQEFQRQAFSIVLLLFFANLINGLTFHKHTYRRNLSHASQLLFKDNLEARNWYYGGQGVVAYRIRLFKSAMRTGLQVCSMETPFVTNDFKRCEKCNLGTPIRNLINSMCQACPNSYAFDVSTGNCSQFRVPINPPPQIHNISQTQPTLQNKNKNENTSQTTQISDPQLCTLQLPFWDLLQKKCEPCPENTEYVSQQKSCLPIQWKLNLNSPFFIQPEQKYAQKQIQLLQQNNSSKFIKQCPIQKPFPIILQRIVKCGECPSFRKYYFVLTALCGDGCNSDSIFNQKQRICQVVQNLVNLSANNLLLISKSYESLQQERQNQMLNTKKLFKMCTKDTPYVINGICSSCPADKPYYAIETNQCAACPPNSPYISEQRKCISPPQQNNISSIGDPSIDKILSNFI